MLSRFAPFSPSFTRIHQMCANYARDVGITRIGFGVPGDDHKTSKKKERAGQLAPQNTNPPDQERNSGVHLTIP